MTPAGKTRPFGEMLLPAARERFLSAGKPMTYARGEQIFHEEEPSSYVAFIQSGTVKIVRRRPDGADMILAIRGPNDLIGDMAAISGLPRSAAAVAMSGVKAWLLTAEAFERVVQTDSTVSWTLITYLASRQRDSEDRRVDQASATVAHRVAAELLDLAERQQDRRAGDGFPVSQGELAEVVGASREAVAKALGEFRRQGLITTGRRRVSILDRDKLVELVGH